jgi:tRNA G18 (ribose-2'-O)-methylase SpoU
MRKLSYQEIFASRPTLAELGRIEKFPFYCLVENVRSLYNVGSIFRTSDAVRIEELYLTGYTGYPPRKEIDKTALGAVDSVSWSYFKDPMQAVEKIKSKKIRLIALEHTTTSVDYNDFDYRYPLCLMLGNEVDGLSEQLLAQADGAVKIPMFGLKQSLNVSVAYGIVMYHVLTYYRKILHKCSKKAKAKRK